MMVTLTEDDIEIGMKVVRKPISNSFLYLKGIIWTVKAIDRRFGEVVVTVKYPSDDMRSRLVGFWDRWELYTPPNDVIKNMI